MLASDVCALVENDGLGTLATMYQISRRSAEQTYVSAKRILNAGYNVQVVPGSDAGTVRASQRPTEDQEPLAAPALEDQAQARARAINAESYGERSHTVGVLVGRIRILERNVQHGYGDASTLHDLALSKRTLEILEGKITA